MKIKKEYIILAAIIIALSVYLVMRRGDRTLYDLPELPEVAQKEITRIQITRGDAVIDLKKKDDKWYIEPQEYPAENDKVADMLESLEKLTLTALVSESENYHLYDLTAQTGINVKAWQGDTLKRNIDVGKTAPSYRHTFVKPAGEDRVFHARGNLRTTFDISQDELRDKTVLAFAPSDIRQIQISKEQQSIDLNRTELPPQEKSEPAEAPENAPPPAKKNAWQTADGRSGDETAVSRLLNTLSNLHCENFIEDRQKEAPTSPLLTVKLQGLQEYKLAIFARAEEKDANYPATSSASDYAFSLSDSLAEDIMEQASEILKVPGTEAANSEKQQPEADRQKE